MDIPDGVAAKVRLLGPRGDRWLAELPDIVARLESAWNITIGRAMTGGNVGWVAEAITSEGTPAVLKVGLPEGLSEIAEFDRELSALLAADGDPYVDVLAYDREDNAVLLERLGRALSTLGMTVAEQIDIIGATVARGWRKPAPAQRITGGQKARWLREYIVETNPQLGSPCAPATIEQVAGYAEQREAAYDDATAVLVHGDAHPNNVLEAGDGRFKLIDPEGLWSEPAHDLGVTLRNWNAELLASEDPALEAVTRVEQMSALTGVGACAIWQWSCIERVSTGMFLHRLGEAEEGQRFFDAADVLAGIDVGS